MENAITFTERIKIAFFAMTTKQFTSGQKVVEFEKIGNFFEAIMQLRISFYQLVLFPKLNKLVIVRPLIEAIFYPIVNIYTIVFSKIFPRKNILYLNNAIVCEKL